MANYFVATFAFGWPTDPVVANILIALTERQRFCTALLRYLASRGAAHCGGGPSIALRRVTAKSYYGCHDRSLFGVLEHHKHKGALLLPF